METYISRQQLNKQFPKAMNIQTTIQELLEVVLSTGSEQKFYKENQQKNMVMRLAAPRTKNDCAGEGQQQITALLRLWLAVSC
jgi:hypothetical protein